ncbi:MAG: type I DNA topoisomerase [Nitrospinota bacterium]|nr:type I DNA topoisomerase [Nitrospinota bacterium]
MSKSLVIVESPAKAVTLKKFLGKNFTIKASVGHILNLPKSKLGVDVENEFNPEFVTIKGKEKVIKELRTAISKVDNVYLAPDPDREGEAIASHILQVIEGKKELNIYRVLFNEITKRSVLEAIKNPLSIDENKVHSQQARRILDRLVGYKISPLLWERVQWGLSAGRVQSVALRLVCEREKEIRAFKPQEYWSIVACLEGETPPSFEAKLFQIDGKKAEIKNEQQAKKILSDLDAACYKISDIQKKERKKNPFPPFITSTLQQEASRKLRFYPRKTMSVAQKLYEGLEIAEGEITGLITYMRTDATRTAPEAIEEVRGLIKSKFGKEYLPSRPNFYKSKKTAQEAHEAIRPTSSLREPSAVKKYLSKDEYSLYELIWKRFVSSQMVPAIMDHTAVDILVGRYLFRANGMVVRFPGFMKLYTEDSNILKSPNKAKQGDEKTTILPPLKIGEELKLLEMKPNQHFTQPPPRFTEASLIKELEDKGIGRPSTYAFILSVIKERDYTSEENRRLKPTELGLIVTDLLVDNFPDILNVEFTARMEEQLDKVEEGSIGWVEILKNFYSPFQKVLKKAEKNMRNLKTEVEETDEVCEKCDHKMVIRWGRFGKFMACSNYPKCKHTKEIDGGDENASKPTAPELTDEKCDKCGSNMVIKTGRFGKFMACSKYPECKFTKPISTGISCPREECDGDVISRSSKRGKAFYGCSKYPNCDFVSWYKPVLQKCPSCGNHYIVERWTKKDGNFLACPIKECNFKQTVEEEAQTEA